MHYCFFAHTSASYSCLLLEAYSSVNPWRCINGKLSDFVILSLFHSWHWAVIYLNIELCLGNYFLLTVGISKDWGGTGGSSVSGSNSLPTRIPKVNWTTVGPMWGHPNEHRKPTGTLVLTYITVAILLLCRAGARVSFPTGLWASRSWVSPFFIITVSLI